MPQISFKKELAPAVLAGTKPFTLRDLRKDGRDPVAGQTLYMFTGLRSKLCEKFAEKSCRFAVTAKLSWRSIMIPTIGSIERDHYLEKFARLDGFANYDEFCRFHKLSLCMQAKPMRLIAWVTREELIELLATEPKPQRTPPPGTAILATGIVREGDWFFIEQIRAWGLCPPCAVGDQIETCGHIIARSITDELNVVKRNELHWKN